MKKKFQRGVDALKTLKNIKKISSAIIVSILTQINKTQEVHEFTAGIKDQSDPITIFLKISTLVCKVIAIEDKIKPKELKRIHEQSMSELTEVDIVLIKNFLQRYEKESNE